MFRTYKHIQRHLSTKIRFKAYESPITKSHRKNHLRIVNARNERDAKIFEYKMRMDTLREEAILATRRAETRRIRDTAAVQADQMVSIRREKFQYYVESHRLQQMIQSHRGHIVPKAVAQSEAMKHLSDARLHVQRNEAVGIETVMKAEAVGLKHLFESLNGDGDLLRLYLTKRSKGVPNEGGNDLKGTFVRMFREYDI